MPVPIFSPDAFQPNADWTKRGWDLPANSLKELRLYLKQRGLSVAAFKKLPVYTLNVDRLTWLRKL